MAVTKKGGILCCEKITSNIRNIQKPISINIVLPRHTGEKAALCVEHKDGETGCYPISNKVTEVLISLGIGYCS